LNDVWSFSNNFLEEEEDYETSILAEHGLLQSGPTTPSCSGSAANEHNPDQDLLSFFSAPQSSSGATDESDASAANEQSTDQDLLSFCSAPQSSSGATVPDESDWWDGANHSPEFKATPDSSVIAIEEGEYPEYRYLAVFRIWIFLVS
jgi:hypothetical protein